MKRLLLALVFVAVSIPAFAQIAAGDEQWLLRAEGSQGAKASPTRIDAAIAAYRAAIAADPASLEARWKLARALRFKGAYTVGEIETKKTIFMQARSITEEAMRLLEKTLQSRGIKSLDKAPNDAVAKAAKGIPHAGETFYWDSVAWGEWAVAYGKMAAVRQGAADRILHSSTIAMLIDPMLEGGGGERVLGRLHNQTPRVPMITGWASDELAVKYLKQSMAHEPGDKLTKVFLAEALVSDSSSNKKEAIELLRSVISTPNDPAFAVEHAAAQSDARKLLADWGAK
jgi:tetratricopeptide (TPR) repeat protein